MLECFLIRRFICGVITSGLTKLFPSLYSQAKQSVSLVEGVRHGLKDKNFPRDEQFREAFAEAKIYGGDRSPKTKIILERLELSFQHKESVDFERLTIEHVMPRTPTDWWRQHLGEDWEAVHDEWLNTIGNLTLTGYNSELSNSDFPTKKSKLLESHVELNKYFARVSIWDEQAIALRGEVAADLAIKVWPDFTLGADGTEVVHEELQEDVKLLVVRVVDHFGGELEKLGKGNRIFYKTRDGKIINVKYSKRHSDYYWFGFHASLWDDIVKAKVTHVAFVMVPDGFVTLPVSVVKKYISGAGFSPKSDGTVRHYHVLISFDPNPELFHHGKTERIALAKYYSEFA